jgi:RHS repeat-associated protein
MSAKTDTATHNLWTYAYDERERLTGITEKNSGGSVIYQATYTYDALDRRIATQIDSDGAGPGSPVTTWSIYDGVNPYADFDGSGTLKERYLYGPAVDELLARTDSGGTTAWYLTDRLGSVRDIASSAGANLDHIAYDGFGNIVSESNSGNGDRFKFTAREWDASTGLQENRERYYAPGVGRWTQLDPIGFSGRDMNMFRYCCNNASFSYDPLGLSGSSGRTSDAYTARQDVLKHMAQYHSSISDQVFNMLANYYDPEANDTDLRAKLREEADSFASDYIHLFIQFTLENPNASPGYWQSGLESLVFKQGPNCIAWSVYLTTNLPIYKHIRYLIGDYESNVIHPLAPYEHHFLVLLPSGYKPQIYPHHDPTMLLADPWPTLRPILVRPGNRPDQVPTDIEALNLHAPRPPIKPCYYFPG